MKKGSLLHTNLLVCTIIVVGFLLTALISYKANWDVFEKDVEQVSDLTMESISHQIDSNFTKPVNISITMANDSLLKAFLEEEGGHLEDKAFVKTMREYLDAYRAKYDYDSVFLVSTQTNRYYHFNGLDRVLEAGNPENDCYYAFLEAGEEYSLNIDNDEAAKDEITVFINAKISDSAGRIMGIVGVGFRVDTLQALLRQYEEKFDVRAYLVAPDGTIEISTDRTGYEAADLFAGSQYAQLRDEILKNKEGRQAFWYGAQGEKGYLAAQYIANLAWHLIIDHKTADMNRQLNRQLFGAFAVLILVVLFVLLTITGIVRKYNRHVVELTVAREQEHQAAFVKATEQMYENIYELDITHNQAASEATETYFESLGAPKGTPFDQGLRIIAEKQIKEEFRQGYIDTFSPQHVLEVYAQGTENLRYDFMICTDGADYYWMRINAHIFTWTEDGSVRMLVYRQNIDAEKRQEQKMLELAQRDEMTGLLTKTATQRKVDDLINTHPGVQFAYFIFDIDNFKQANDQFGHDFGDSVICSFTKIIHRNFRQGDVLGRIGGDEFVVFVPCPGRGWAQGKAADLCRALSYTHTCAHMTWQVSASIGVALCPAHGADPAALYKNADTALYQTKRRGKGGFTIYQD